MPKHLDNLSIASANHLHNQGHITLGQRNDIHEAVRRKVPKPKAAAPRSFGSLAQQAQYPIPAVGRPGPEPDESGGY